MDFEARQTEWAEFDRRAAEVRPLLWGKTIAAAEAKVAEYEGVSLQFTDKSNDSIVTLDYRPGKIMLFVRDGLVVAPEDI